MNAPTEVTGVTIPVKVRMDEIRIQEFTITHAATQLTEQIPLDKYNFNTSTTFSLNKENSIMGAHIDMNLSDESNAITLANIKTSFLFSIQNLDELIARDEEGKDSISNEMLFHLLLIAANVSISTTRGMFIAKTEGTILSNAYFPIYDPVSFIPKEVRDKVLKEK